MDQGPNGQPEFSEAPPNGSQNTDAESGRILCPKCRKEQQASDTCIMCGLVFKKYKPAADKRTQGELKPSALETNPIVRTGNKKEYVNVVNVLVLLLIIDSTLSLIKRFSGFVDLFGSVLPVPGPQKAKYLYDLITTAMLFVSAFGLLMRKQWARILVICLMSLSLAEGLYVLVSYQVALHYAHAFGDPDQQDLKFASYRLLAGCAVYAFFIAKLLTRKVRERFSPNPGRVSSPGAGEQRSIRTKSAVVLASVFILCAVLFFFVFPKKKAVGVQRHIAMCMGDPAHTGVARAQGVHKLDVLLWRFEGRDGTGPCIVVDDEAFYFVDRREKLYAIDRSSGTQKWKFSDNPVTSNPLIVDDIVYFGTAIGALYAIDGKTGREKWRFQTGKEAFVLNMTPIASSPAMAGDALYFGNALGYLYAVDVETRKELWKFKTGGPVLSSPALDNDTVYFGSGDGKLYALTADAGKEKWTFDAKGPLYSSPVVAGRLVLFRNEDGNLVAVNAETGAQEWKFEAIATTRSSPAVADNTAYVGDKEGRFFAVDLRTGAEKWRFKAGSGIYSTPVIADGIVYFGCRDGYLYALDTATGGEKWKYETGGVVDSSPAVADYLVVVGNADGTLYALSEDGPQEAGKK